MSVPKCTSWLGHRFEARYSTVAPPDSISEVMASLDGNTAYAGKLILDGLTSHHYAGDVCTRCGYVVNRMPAAVEPT